jgi:DNA-binding MarR family transcriptional regulator
MEKPCKEWTGARFKKGYGARRYKGKTWRVHRAVWDDVHGPIPDGLKVLHRCDNPPCYEITHLYLGTSATNSRDMVARNRQAVRGRLPQSKLTVEDVAAIRARYADGGITQANLAAEYAVAQGAISKIVRRGVKTGTRRRTQAEVAAIRYRYDMGQTQASLAAEFGIDQSSISDIVHNISHVNPTRAVQSRRPQSKLTVEQHDAIRTRYAESGATQAALAAEYGVTQKSISVIIRRGGNTGTTRRSKLTVEQRDAIRARYAAGGITQAKLAAEYGVTQGAISAVVRAVSHVKRTTG